MKSFLRRKTNVLRDPFYFLYKKNYEIHIQNLEEYIFFVNLEK